MGDADTCDWCGGTLCDEYRFSTDGVTLCGGCETLRANECGNGVEACRICFGVEANDDGKCVTCSAARLQK